MSKAKPFAISKLVVRDAYLQVKANKGGAGIDGVGFVEFERDLKGNLYRIWNRMSSGTYFPPPVRTVAIPKKDGGKRKLGIPTIGDRVAQAVVKMYLEPLVEPCFHPDSYGYRPNKSAHGALATARARCWERNWVIDLDIRGFFDNLDHALIMRAVRKHTDTKWILLYIERWLKAPVQQEDGTLVERTVGSPQGSVISPLLANIFMHHAFDEWMQREYPYISFERYADDVLLHCLTEKQARFMLDMISKRLKRCRLELHPQKTRVVYCKDKRRSGSYSHESFDFLGFTFRPRMAYNEKTGERFVGFNPAISNRAAKKIRAEIRSWKLHLCTNKSLADLAKMFNAVVHGWVNYYGRFNQSAMRSTLRKIEEHLVLWVRRKFKKLRRSPRRARCWLARVAKCEPALFVHWKLGLGSWVG